METLSAGSTDQRPSSKVLQVLELVHIGIGINVGVHSTTQCYTHKDQGRHYFRQLELQPRECVRQRDRGSGRLGERMDSEVPSVLPVDQHDPHNAGALAIYIKAVNYQHHH